MGSPLMNLLAKPVFLIILAIVVIMGFLLYRHYHKTNKTTEGFYPVSEQRINFGETAMRRYNDYGSTQLPTRLNVIPDGPAGDKQLKDLMESPAYEGDSKQKAMAGLNYDEEFKYKAPPELLNLMNKIKKCESVKSWDCNAFEDPEFASYCAICTKDGTTHDNKPHIGGLYIDPQQIQRADSDARGGKRPEYSPSAGTCKGEFLRGRPYCDTQKDRYECSVSHSFDDNPVKEKCALCLNATDSNTFVYINKRLGKASGYGLKSAKQVKFPVNLRLCLAQTEGIELIIRDEAGKIVARANRGDSSSGFIGGSDTALFTLPDCYEGKKFTISIRLPQFRNYAWSDADTNRINEMSAPKRAKLVRAMYGPWLNDYKRDDPRAAEVTNYLKAKFSINDCSKTDVVATNDGLGGDPNPGIYKQLRLVYSENGTDFAYAFAGEGGKSVPIMDENFKTLCPASVPVNDAEAATCETTTNGEPTKRVYVLGDNIKNYYGAAATGGTETASSSKSVTFYSACNYGGKATSIPVGDYPFQKLMATGYGNDTLQSVKVPSGLAVIMWEHDIGGGREVKLTADNPCLSSINYMNTVSSCRVIAERTVGRCVEQLPKKVQGIAGMWESHNGLVKRFMPINRTVTMINGFTVSSAGPPILGTLKSSKYHKSKAKSSIVDLPDYLFWFWAKDHKTPTCEFTVVVPATFRDPTVHDDMSICPAGPLVQTKEAAANLQASACEKLVDGKPQEAGTFTADCIKSLYLSAGCTPEGKAFPTSAEVAKKLSKNPMTGQDREIDDITSTLDDMYSIAKTGADGNGTTVGDEEYAQAAEDCFGKIVLDPCDTPNKLTGPHTQGCLDYLFRNAGKDNPDLGNTYVGMTNRSSGSDRTKKTPVMYCQRRGTMSPIGADGKPNFDAIQTANSFGGVAAVKEFYRQIHYDANFNTQSSAQKVALNQCYGVIVKAKAPTCKGVKARYLMVKPSMLVGDSYIQISQIQVFNVYDVNVALRKSVSSSSSWDGVSTATKAVDGQAKNRSHPEEFHSASPNRETEWWKVDFGKVEEIAYVVYYNRADCCSHRSRGMRIQLLGENQAVIKEKQLQGGMVETVMFSNAKPSGLIRTAMDFVFIPARFPGSILSIQPSGEALIKKRQTDGGFVASTQFVVTAPNNNAGGAFSFKHKTSDRWLRIQGFRLRLTADDGSGGFKNESSFKVGESVAGNPGEISFESVSNPGTYLGVVDNTGVYSGPIASLEQQKLASWRLPTTI